MVRIKILAPFLACFLVASVATNASALNLANTLTDNFHSQKVPIASNEKYTGGHVASVSTSKVPSVKLEQELTALKDCQIYYKANANVIET